LAFPSSVRRHRHCFLVTRRMRRKDWRGGADQHWSSAVPWAVHVRIIAACNLILRATGT